MDESGSSRIPGFYKKPKEERLEIVAKKCGLSDEDIKALTCDDPRVMFDIVDGMIENVVGMFPFPVGIAVNFVINGIERLIPMVIEEPSVVAAASNIARMTRDHGGFKAEPVKSIMIGQIQLLDMEDVDASIAAIENDKERLLAIANEQDPLLVKLGGGAMDLECHPVDTSMGKMLDVHLLVNCLDAMGANAVNTMAEALAPELEKLAGGRALLRIISNLAVHRVARCTATFDKELLGGEQVVDRIIEAVEFANNDIYRAATHNKGIMNGVSAVVRATGNDTRAIEAGAHSYAARNGRYRSLTRFSKDDAGNLVGSIEIPMAVGIVGGATRTHPVARACLKIMGITNAEALAQTIAAVGLAQNVAALRALVSEGIQEGHMKLHARNIVKMAGVPDEYQERVIEALVERGKIRVDVAKEIYKELAGSLGETGGDDQGNER